jgi:catechol 2,3-dioxygenase-like lactoylglutathione lyase family enzyme
VRSTRCNVQLTMLQHVTLEVTAAQVRACVAFWELLGFTEMEPPPLLRDRFTWVEREGTQIHLVPVEDPIAAREGHVAVLADDYDATLARLAEHGFAVREGSNAWNAARVFTTDPAGHRIEVMSKAPHPPWP